MKVRDVIKLVEADGWQYQKSEGSHRKYRHPTKAGRVIIAGHPSEEVKPKTLASVLRQAGISRK